MKEEIGKLTDTHRLGSNCYWENHEAENLGHLEIAVEATIDKKCSDVEKECFRQVDRTVSYTLCASFNKSTSDAGCQRFIDGHIVPSPENVIKCHKPDGTNIDDNLGVGSSNEHLGL